MTVPKENEELDEELSSEELKSVSGGFRINGSKDDAAGLGISAGADCDPDFKGAQGTGSGMTKGDWEKSKKTGLVRGHLDY